MSNSDRIETHLVYVGVGDGVLRFFLQSGNPSYDNLQRGQLCMASNQWKKGLAVIASVSAMGMLLAGCGGTTTTTNNTTAPGGTTAGQPHLGGNILLDSNANWKDFDPALNYDTTSNELVTELYDTLITYKGTTAEIRPKLASSWTVSADGLTYTFNLRKDVTFWNGDKMTAQSFVDEFQRVLDPKVASPGEGFLDPIVQGSTAFNKGKATSVSGLSAPDPYTFVVKLTKPEPFFLDVLAMPFFSAVDKAYIDKVGNKAFDSTTAMGTGPFELKSVTTNQAVLTKNPKYWETDSFGNHLPYLDQVTIRINKNDQVDALNFQQGQTALMGNLIGIPSAVYPTFKANPTYSKLIQTVPQNSVFYVGLNSKVKPFDNVLVRQAMEYAVNKDKIVQLMNGRGQTADQPLPPGLPGYVSKSDMQAAGVEYTLDTAKAKQLLTQAGFPNGFSTTLYVANTPDFLKIAGSVQNDLAQIGVKVNIQQSDWNTFLDTNEKGNVQPMFLLGWFQDFPDASDFLNTLFNTNQQPANNSSMYSNPQVDSWLNKAQTDTNQAERLDLYKQATIQIMKDAPWVPEYYPTATMAVQSWTHGYYSNPSLPDPLQYMWIDAGHSQG